MGVPGREGGEGGREGEREGGREGNEMNERVNVEGKINIEEKGQRRRKGLM